MVATEHSAPRRRVYDRAAPAEVAEHTQRDGRALRDREGAQATLAALCEAEGRRARAKMPRRLRMTHDGEHAEFFRRRVGRDDCVAVRNEAVGRAATDEREHEREEGSGGHEFHHALIAAGTSGVSVDGSIGRSSWPQREAMRSGTSSLTPTS